jgi:hypothetical protein
MSEIQRYKLVVGDFDAELLPDDFGSYVEYRDHQAKIKELESQLEQAKKEGLEAKQDQVRYQWIVADVNKDGGMKFDEYLYTSFETLNEFIDAAIQENQQ